MAQSENQEGPGAEVWPQWGHLHMTRPLPCPRRLCHRLREVVPSSKPSKHVLGAH